MTYMPIYEMIYHMKQRILIFTNITILHVGFYIDYDFGNMNIFTYFDNLIPVMWNLCQTIYTLGYLLQ